MCSLLARCQDAVAVCCRCNAPGGIIGVVCSALRFAGVASQVHRLLGLGRGERGAACREGCAMSRVHSGIGISGRDWPWPRCQGLLELFMSLHSAVHL